MRLIVRLGTHRLLFALVHGRWALSMQVRVSDELIHYNTKHPATIGQLLQTTCVLKCWPLVGLTEEKEAAM